MGWQKDRIEELADELEIDGGDSSSQQDRLRTIASEVGMENFNGISNADTDELERRLRDRKRNSSNNKNAVNSARRNPRTVGKGMNALNKKRPQRAANRYGNLFGRKGRNAKTTSTGSSASIPSNGGKQQVKGEIRLPIPPKVKLILIAAIALFALIALAIFILFGAEIGEGSGGGVGGGSFAYGQTCTTITVENSGCDENGNNCTLIYDGEVDLESYIAGVIAAESVGINNQEYYKLAAINARTYILDEIDESCTVEGNKNFLNYIDIKDSPYASQIKQAVSDTDSQVLIANDKMIDAKYDYGYIETEDDQYYYIGYGYYSLDSSQLQQIPKTWVEQKSLGNKLTKTNKSKYDMTIVGALYLMENEGYSYNDVIEYYYGTNVQIQKNTMILKGQEGFMNPTRLIRCTSPFGPRTHPVKGNASNHTGIDIGISGGEPIYAAKAGVITKVVNTVNAINNCNYGYGNYVVIEHSDGMSTLYAHIKYGSIPDYVVSGAEIKQGIQIGEVGSTGCSTGNHLHYEVKYNGSVVDPADYLNLEGATGTCKR